LVIFRKSNPKESLYELAIIFRVFRVFRGGSMNFVLTMAWRDSRASRWRLLFVLLAVVPGIAALVGIAGLGDNLQRTVELQTKSLLGSDLTITARKAFSPETLAYFRSIGGEMSQEVALTSMVGFPTRNNQRRLVQVRALEGGFPFYGELVTSPAGAMPKLSSGNFAVVEETLLVQFGVQIGDEVKIGQRTFKVLAALKKIPGESAAA
jgi:putative ABC transport system permease protein